MPKTLISEVLATEPFFLNGSRSKILYLLQSAHLRLDSHDTVDSRNQEGVDNFV